MCKQTRLMYETYSLLCEEKGKRQTKKKKTKRDSNITMHTVIVAVMEAMVKSYYRYCVLRSHLSLEDNCLNVLI